MPRGKRPTQPAAVGPSQVYGQGQELTQSMKTVPLPDSRAQLMQGASQGLPATAPAGQVTAPATGGRVPGQGGAAVPAGGAPTPADTWGNALSAATQLQPPANGGSLGQAASGMLATGAPQHTPGAEFWSKLAQITGDPAMLRLAQRARLVR